VWDKVFEEKSKLALKAKLEKDDPDIVKMHRKVVDGKTEQDITEWEAIFKLSDECIVFLESQYCMTLVSELLLNNIPWLVYYFLRVMLTSKNNEWQPASLSLACQVTISNFIWLATTGTMMHQRSHLLLRKVMECSDPMATILTSEMPHNSRV
jgi:hypothetical protein